LEKAIAFTLKLLCGPLHNMLYLVIILKNHSVKFFIWFLVYQML